jgi:hypothetical protein
MVALPIVVEPSLKSTVPVAADGETVAANVTVAPTVAGFALLVKVTDEERAFTVCVRAEEALEPHVLLPPKDAVTEWTPTDSADVVRVAVPFTRVPEPRLSAPSLKAIDPLHVGVTDAVNVTGLPALVELVELDNEVVVGWSVITCSTAEEVEASVYESPL